MTEHTHPEHKPEETAAPTEASGFEDQVDDLLSEVDALAEEILAESEQYKREAGNSVPDREAGHDPARAVVQDDVGLSDEAPLIQDGERVDADEIVADVDRELDHMEELIARLGEVPSVAPGLEPFGRIPEIPETPAQIPREPSPQGPAQSSGASPAAGADEEPCEIGGLAAEIEEILAPAADQAATASEHPAAATAADSAPSKVEKELDDDLDALLGGNPLGASDAPAAVSEGEPSFAGEIYTRATIAAEHTPSDRDDPLADVSVIGLIKSRLRARFDKMVKRATDNAIRGLIWLLDGIEQRLGQRLSANTKELLGYCALGTLAMAIVALFLAML